MDEGHFQLARLRSRNQRNLLFLAALVLMVTGMMTVSRSNNPDAHRQDVERFERVLHRKEQRIGSEFAALVTQFSSRSPMDVLNERSPEYQKLALRHGIAYFYYEGDRLRYWSDHSIPVPPRWNPRLEKRFLSFRNADYVTLVRETDSGRLLGLIEVRTHFPFQNEYLQNGFQGDFPLDAAVQIDFLEEQGNFPVFNRAGAYLFSLDFGAVPGGRSDLTLVSRICMVLSVLFLFAAMFRSARDATGRRRWIWIILVALGIPGAVYLFLGPGVHWFFEQAPLFRPDLYASGLFPSLGHLLVTAGSVLAVVWFWYRYTGIPDPGKRRHAQWRSVPLFVMASILFLVVEQVIRSLVLDSGISFEIHRITSVSGYTVLGVVVLIAGFLSTALVLDRGICHLESRTHWVLLYGGGAATGIFLLSWAIPGLPFSPAGWAGILLLIPAQLYIRRHHPGAVPFSRFIFVLIGISAFIVISLHRYNRERKQRQKEVELVKLASEHDPVAEMLFSELSLAIRNDSVLASYLEAPLIEIDPLVDRLRRNYFSGYWTRYDLQVTVCRPDDRVYLEPPDDEWRHCYSFFEEMMQAEGIEVPGSDFYFLDNLNGRISYLAVIPFYGEPFEHRIYLELDSRILSEELGYPELLIDEDYSSFRSSDFSYARYSQRTLISRDGEYPYRRSPEFYSDGEETFETVSRGGYDHSIYNVDEEHMLIVGSPSVTAVDYLISFSYLFAFSFLLSALVYLLTRLSRQRPGLNWNFKNRIQYSMVGILFLTFALICAGTIYFIVQQYREENNDNLRNTMRSVYIELIHKVEFEEDLRNWSSGDYYTLDELLRKFSNVFYSDINLYDRNGILLATSRAEIFDRQLLSRRMNRLVYESLSKGKASEYIHEEHIGEMRYISAYVPLLNSENQLLAYLNLPYFTHSEALTRDVTNLVMAVINIYLILLLLIIGASVFLADRITQPLRVIQNRIAQVSLSAKNEMIRYERKDEIRGLVEEYNHMVLELERSAGLLAQSERESAWREMAKQIAHEIKNPLTPMKLNVQHLQRTLEEGDGDPGRVNRIATTLIEQIDSLSAIANEFSDFAKMPRARYRRINLVTLLNNLLQLFDASEKESITLDLGEVRRAMIHADKEQLTRVFINLVKNGIQAVPEGRRARITIALEVRENLARVTVSDNGKGIPEEIRDKLFRPNFTTKSAGMGMGLAISHNIVRSLGGSIGYETELNEGTTFFVELPLMKEKQTRSPGGSGTG